MRQADRDSDMDEQDKYHTEMDLMRKHAEQRVAVMQGENIQLDDELEEVRNCLSIFRKLFLSKIGIGL